jgi:hypothetical protein
MSVFIAHTTYHIFQSPETNTGGKQIRNMDKSMKFKSVLVNHQVDLWLEFLAVKFLFVELLAEVIPMTPA